MFEAPWNVGVDRRAEDRILVARVYGAAGRHANQGVPDQEAIAELHTITTRPDLLGQAAGMFQASDDPWPERNRRAAQLLLAAGADPAVAATSAAKVRERLARRPISY